MQTNIKQKGYVMANCTYFKLEVNGMILPDIYFDYEQAKAALKNIYENNVATIGRVITFN